MQNIQNQIKHLLQQALSELDIPFEGEIKLEHPGNPEHGEWSSNVALAGFKGKKERESRIESFDELRIIREGTSVSNVVSDSSDNKQPTTDQQTNRQTEYRSPRDLAQAIADLINSQNTKHQTQITKIEVAGPGFINFYLSEDFYLAEMGKLIENEGNISLRPNRGKLAIVEFSSPNIAKPFTIGHLRSTIIGSAVANLLEATGYSVLRDNHLGDWGTQFGKLIYAIKNFGEGSEEKNIAKISTSERPVKELVDLYVEFHAKAEENPDLDDEGRKWFKKLEDGDPEAKALWQKCIDWSWVEFNKIYEQLGVTFSEELDNGRGLGESFFEDKMDGVIQELAEKQIMTEGEGGAKLVFFPEDKLPPLMILKKDGATLYATRDLATDKYRKEQWNPDMIINEVGGEQALYFRQIFETEKMLGWYTDGQRVHVKHGLYRFKDKKMSTRKGNVIWLEDVIAEAVKRAGALARERIEDQESRIENGERSPSTGSGYSRTEDKETDHKPQNTNHQTQKIGIGALKWNDLRRSSELDIVFDWDEMLSMEGNSGPYMQYTYVRTHSILKKFKKMQEELGLRIKDRGTSTENGGRRTESGGSRTEDREGSGAQELQSSKVAELQSDSEAEKAESSSAEELKTKDYRLKTDSYHPNQEELTVLRKLARFEETVLASATEYSPHVLCTYLYELAQAFNSFYNKHSVLGDLDSRFQPARQAQGDKLDSSENKSEIIVSDQTVLRLGLVRATNMVVEEGLRLLGIEVVEEM